MVKHLRYCAKGAKLLVLGLLLVVIWGAIWLQSGQRDLAFAKPWIEKTLNPPDAPYSITFSDLKIDWTSFAELGRVHINHVNIAKKDGAVFAQFPEIYATIDPFGFLPYRTVINKIVLSTPHLFLTHSADGTYKVGLDDTDSPMALTELFPGLNGDSQKESKPIHLPFHDFELEHAVVNFYDEKSDSRVISKDLKLVIVRHYSRYDGKLFMPFTYEDEAGTVSATLSANTGRADYRLDTILTQIPAKLLCTLGACPEQVETEGFFNATARFGITPEGVLDVAWVKANTKNATLTAPQWFEKPLKLGTSELVANYDSHTKTVTVTSAKSVLEDTTIWIKGTGQEQADGWHIEADGGAGRLDVVKLRKYWPLTMAHDSREWVTSKMPAGWATGNAQFHITPADIAAGELSDASLSADVDTHDMSVDYLPGFPELHHVDGKVHFTGHTVRVEANSGTMLDGTTVTKAILICPDLMNPKNPMETDMVVEMPMSDVAQMLDLDTFTFDDAAGLDAKKIQGHASLTMNLKFNAFSGAKETNPNVIHLEAVNYDIAAHLTNVAQDKLFGGYNVKSLNGDLKADVKSTSFNGVVTLGDSAPAEVALDSREGKPLTVTVKSVAQQNVPAANDFALTYQSGEVKQIKVTGKRLDASVSYGGQEHGALKDFPAMALDVDLGELLLAPQLPFTDVKGTLNCDKIRCNAAHFTAMQGKSDVHADINHEGGPRQLTVTASDAGAFLKGLDITDRMIGGKLELHGTYDDSKSPPPFNGKLAVHNFTLINSQILGRILSIGSLTGLSNALTGSGISFDKLIAMINARAGLITLSDGRANGTAMGLTVAGTVDTNTSKLALKGVVVPAYAINSFLGKIPIIGAIAGGENEGLIAFNYSVGGTYEQPDVGVNPFSGLTPGFLRGIFGAFDQTTTEKKADKAPVYINRNVNRP